MLAKTNQFLSSLQRADVIVGDNQLVIHLRKSKTDQSGKEKLIVRGGVFHK